MADGFVGSAPLRARRWLGMGLSSARRLAGRELFDTSDTVRVAIERFSYSRDTLVVSGWAIGDQRPIVAGGLVLPGGERRLIDGFGRPSPELVAREGPKGRRARFAFEVSGVESQRAADVHPFFVLANGAVFVADLAATAALAGGAFAGIWADFRERLGTRPPGAALEVGSRDRSGRTREDTVPAGWSYTGFDILAGPNVDVVGDAHRLGSHFPPESFDAVFSVATFEHLAMPWKAAVEINKVLKVGGLVFVASHQCWPLHEEPWDFFRFSDAAWRSLFNASTGFEVVSAVMGEPAEVVAHIANPITAGLGSGVGYLGSSVIAVKTGASAVDWEVDTSTVAEGLYPR